MELIFIKLGGSVLTDKTAREALNQSLLHQVAGAIAAALDQHPASRILIGHGGGSFGHPWAARYGTHLGVKDAEGWHGVARVADAMGRLNRAVVGALLDANVNAISVQPSASALASARQLQQINTSTIERMLAAGLVPVVFGDVVLDTAQGAAIISTEALFSYLAPRLQPQRIVLVGERGVFTADPRRDPTAQRIATITSSNIDQITEHLGGSHGTDVTGGMASKVHDMWRLVQAVPELEVRLIGTDPATMQQAILGEATNEGTVIRA